MPRCRRASMRTSARWRRWAPVGLWVAANCLLAGCRDGGSAAAGADGTVIQNKGSDTMLNLALAWAEAYHAARPAVSVAVTGGGSGTGIAGLLNGTVDVANASRAL